MRYVVGLLAILCLAAVATAAADKAPEPLTCSIRLLQDEITLGVPFAIEVTLTNVSDKRVAMPNPAGPVRPYTWEEWTYLEFPDGQKIGDSYQRAASSHPAPVLGAKDLMLLAPKAQHRYTYWVLWEGAEMFSTEYWPFPTAKAPAKYALNLRVASEYTVAPKDPLPADVIQWHGSTCLPVPVGTVSLDPAATVALVLETVGKNKVDLVRQQAFGSLAHITCRRFGKGPLLTDDDLAEAAKWFDANRGKGRQAWIVAALSSKDEAERKLAKGIVIQAKAPTLADALVALLDTAEPETADKVLDALWANYDDPRVLAYARKVIREGSYEARWSVVGLAHKHKIQPIMKEADEALPGWIRAERDPKALIYMIAAVNNSKIAGAIPALEELDRRDPTPAPKELILALCDLKGKDYEPGLIRHLAEDKDPVARRWAAWALATWGSDKCFDALITALADPNGEVKQSACYALQQQGRNGALEQRCKAAEVLIRLLDTDETVDRNTIENALVYLYIPNGPAKGGTRHEAAEAWRALLRRALDKK
jgi:hypothetical protein